MGELVNKLIGYAESISDESVRKVTLGILTQPTLSFTDVKPIVGFLDSPAAPRKHHSFTGGLLLHTIGVVEASLRIREYVEMVYGLKADRDLVAAAALLHDLFKFYQYRPDEVEGGYKPREDWYLSHDYSIIGELARRGAPEKLIRVVAEVHGLQPFTTIEGLVAHLADSLDARLGDILQQMLLGKLRALDKEGCNPYKVMSEKARSDGPEKVFERAFSPVDIVVSEFKKYCGG